MISSKDKRRIRKKKKEKTVSFMTQRRTAAAKKSVHQHLLLWFQEIDAISHNNQFLFYEINQDLANNKRWSLEG